MTHNLLPTPEFTPFATQPLAPLPNIFRKTLDAFSEQCSSGNDVYQRNTTVILNVAGHSDEISQSDYDATSNAFITAYNELGANRCFQITEISVDTGPEDSNSTETDQQRRTRMLRSQSQSVLSKRRELQFPTFDFTLWFRILHRCLGCPLDFSLFNDASRRRRLSHELVSKHRFLEGDISSDNGDADADAICSANTPEACTGPTPIEFQDRMTQILIGNPPPSINNVLEVSELKTYPCSESIDTIDTTIGLNLLGDYEYLNGIDIDSDSLPELKVMEHVVATAYNSINMANPETCDEEFRRVANVKFASAENFSQDGNGFTMLFNVSYKCRDCALSPTRTLLDDIAAGSAGTNSENRKYYHIDLRDPGPNEPPCVCAIKASIFRGPTSQEFSEAIRCTISARRQQGILTFVDNIDLNQTQRSYEISSPVAVDPPAPAPAEPPTDPSGVQGDPIIIGLKGQVFKFDGRDGGWYANVASKSFHWNMQFRKYPTCEEGSDVFISGLTFITPKESDMQHQTSESNVLIATTPEPIPECRGYDQNCLGDGTLHISFDGGQTYVSQPGDYNYASRNRIVAHNTYAACSRRWHDYDITPKVKNFRRGRRVTINEKKPLELLSEKNETMINPQECLAWIEDRKNKNDLFQQKGLWSSLYVQTPSVSFHIEYRQSNLVPIEEQCTYQSLDAWMTTVSKKSDSQSWQGILGETKKDIYDDQGQQILSDRKHLLRGNRDMDYEVEGPFGIHFNAKNKIRHIFGSKFSSSF